MTRIRRSVCAFAFALLTLSFASPARADVDLWPLLELSDQTTTVMYPFYVHEGKFMMVFPVYYRTDDGHEHHVLWPLFKERDGRITRVAPFWFSTDPDKYWIVPFAYHDAKQTLLLMPPSYFRGDEIQVVAPLFVHSKSATDDWLVVGPRLFGWHDTAQQNHYFAGLLGDYSTRPNGEWEGSLFPAIFAWGGSPKRGLVVPPILWSEHTADSSTLWLAGYLRSHSPTKDAWAMYPFFASKRETAYNGDLTRRLSILWPIYKRKETTTPSGQMTFRHRRFLAFADDTTPTRRQLSLFGFVVRESTN